VRLAVIGAGWSGLAAAVHACGRGHQVTLLEMAREPGGRARSVQRDGDTFDNGQHILIGAYAQTLALMSAVGVDLDATLLRQPLALPLADGTGLRLPSGPPAWAFARGVLGNRAWPLRDRLALLRHALGWWQAGFRCDADLTVAGLTRTLPRRVREELIDPLSVAALNTPSHEASAAVLLRVLRDGLFGGPGSADLLLPRQPLGDLLPLPACRWLSTRGAALRMGRRVRRIERPDGGWLVDGEAHDAVIVATSAVEAARLLAPTAPGWARMAEAVAYEPIVTVLVRAPGARLPAPMISLPEGPAQFAFDHGAVGGPADRFAFVISGAAPWVERGREATQAAVLEQAQTRFPRGTWPQAPQPIATLVEHRATFRCVPALRRPPSRLGHNLFAAGDYVDGPYPATLEGAVRSGIDAASLCN
jgi:squalene-associated FAD-dependent desaturase